MIQFTCRRCTELIIDFVCEDIGSDDKQQFEAHLTVCPPCDAMVASYRVTITLAKRLPPKPMPAHLMERLQQLLAAQQAAGNAAGGPQAPGQ